jgi:hypothetical protein
MARVRVQQEDPSLPHQVRLRFRSKRNNEVTLLYCSCSHDPIAEFTTGDNDAMWLLFNDPERHDNSRTRFVPRAQHTANVKVYEVE